MSCRPAHPPISPIHIEVKKVTPILTFKTSLRPAALQKAHFINICHFRTDGWTHIMGGRSGKVWKFPHFFNQIRSLSHYIIFEFLHIADITCARNLTK